MFPSLPLGIIRRRGKASTSSTQLTIFHHTGAARRTNNFSPFRRSSSASFYHHFPPFYFSSLRSLFLRPPFPSPILLSLFLSFFFSFFRAQFPAFSSGDKYFDWYRFHRSIAFPLVDELLERTGRVGGVAEAIRQRTMEREREREERERKKKKESKLCLGDRQVPNDDVPTARRVKRNEIFKAIVYRRDEPRRKGVNCDSTEASRDERKPSRFCTPRPRRNRLWNIQNDAFTSF